MKFVVMAAVLAVAQGVVLLQLDAHVLEVKKTNMTTLKELPSIVDVTKGSSLAFDAVTSKISALRDHVASVRRKHEEQLSKDRADIARKLELLAEATRQAKELNNDIFAENAGIRLANAQLRKKSQQLLEETERLASTLKALQSNLTKSESLAHAALLGAIRLEPGPVKEVEALPRLGLLELSAERHENFTSDLRENSNEMYDSSLLGNFHKKRDIAETEYTAVMKEQAQLNATRSSLLDMRGKLRDAVDHLERTRARLDEEIVTVRQFAQRMVARSDTAQDTPAASLQALAALAGPEDKQDEKPQTSEESSPNVKLMAKPPANTPPNNLSSLFATRAAPEEDMFAMEDMDVEPEEATEQAAEEAVAEEEPKVTNEARKEDVPPEEEDEAKLEEKELEEATAEAQAHKEEIPPEEAVIKEPLAEVVGEESPEEEPEELVEEPPVMTDQAHEEEGPEELVEEPPEVIYDTRTLGSPTTPAKKKGAFSWLWR